MFTRPYRLKVVGIVLTAAALLLAAGGTGCGAAKESRLDGAAQPRQDAAPATTADAAGGPFAIPAPSVMYSQLQETGRSASGAASSAGIAGPASRAFKAASSVMTHSGSEFEAAQSQRITADETEAVFDSAWLDGYSTSDTVAYATYRFDLRWRQGDLKLRTEWSRPGAVPPLNYAKVWFGASNWDKNRWDWYSGASGGSALTAAGSIDAYTHPATDEMLVIVVKLLQSPHQLKRVWLSDYALRGEWWMAGRNEQRAASAPLAGPAGPTVRWQSRIADGLHLQPPVYDADGNLYFAGSVSGSATRTLASIGPNGSPRWTFPMTPLDNDSPGWSSPAMSYGGGIYYALHHGPLYAVYLDGTPGWEFSGHKAVDGEPALAQDGTCYVIGRSGDTYTESYLHALTAQGVQSWEYAFGEYEVSSPALSQDGAVYVGCGDKQLYAFAPDGSVSWKYLAQAPISSSLALASDGTVYFTDDLAMQYAVRADGTLAWSYQLPGSPGSTLPGAALGPDGEICIAAPDGRLHTLNPDGTLRWTYPVGPCQAAPTVDIDGTVYVSSMNCRLYAIGADGALKWWYVAAAPLCTQPVMAEDGTLYVTSVTDVMYAIGPGTPAETYTISGYVKDAADAGLPAVTVTISGSEPVLTDAEGFWSKSGVTDGYYMVSPALDGYHFAPLLDIVAVSGSDVTATEFVGSPQDAPIWPMWGHDRAHTRRSPYNGTSVVQTKWIAQYDGNAVVSEPILGADGTVYIQYASGILRAFDSNGDELWQYLLWSASQATPVLAPDAGVYSSSVDGLVYAFAPAGIYRWTWGPLLNLSGSPTLAADGALIHSDATGGLVSLSPAGVLNWTYSASGGGNGATPAIDADGNIYFGNGVDTIYALNPDGTEKWTFAADTGGMETPAQTSPAIADDGTIYMGFGKNFYALNPDGTQKWVYPIGIETRSAPAVAANGTVYFGTEVVIASHSALLLALDADGTKLWETTSASAVRSPVTIDGAGRIYASVKFNETGGGVMSAMSAGGAEIWTIDMPGNVTCGATIGADGTVYFSDDEGITFAIGSGAG